jgi:hypothetical protein
MGANDRLIRQMLENPEPKRKPKPAPQARPAPTIPTDPAELALWQRANRARLAFFQVEHMPHLFAEPRHQAALQDAVAFAREEEERRKVLPRP